MTTPRPQDTDPLRAKGTDRRKYDQPRTEMGHRLVYGSLRDMIEVLGYGWSMAEAVAVIEQEAARLVPPDPDPLTLTDPPPYPGWSSPPGPLSRLVAWVRKWRRP